jgi:hypothetical protein
MLRTIKFVWHVSKITTDTTISETLDNIYLKHLENLKLWILVEQKYIQDICCKRKKEIYNPNYFVQYKEIQNTEHSRRTF